MAATEAAAIVSPGWHDVRVASQDGLVLHARDYGPRAADATPVVCVPGLTRNAADFHELAVHLSRTPRHPRRVVAIDYRGRGKSDHDRDWRNYTPMTEAGDVINVVTALGIGEACVVGTSRGGMIAMLLAALRPTMLKAVVLNDIGPAVDGRGLARIKNTLEATQRPASWADAAELMKRAYAPNFPDLTAADWDAMARRTYAERDGRPVIAYDPKLLKVLSRIDFGSPLPTMWPQFDALVHVPVMVLRGASSDILSAETVTSMRARRPDLEVVEIPNAGHAPQLRDAAEIEPVAAFIAAAENRRR
jgi:pimeloyl-ACP methyl ester carboxylesterase